MFFYLASSSFVFPFLGLYMRDMLGISLTLVGVVQGISSFAGMPFQVLGGFWADRRGRRGVLLLSLLSSAVLFAALAFAHALWLVVTLVVAQGALGWPMFLTASNAMVADLVPPRRTAEAYGLMRVAMNAGVIGGPAIASLALRGGAGYGGLFMTAAIGCAALYVVLLLRLQETRPAGATGHDKNDVVPGHGATPDDAPTMPDEAATMPEETALGAAVDPFVPKPGGGYGAVLRDRRFLAVCAVSLLPLFCYGHIVTTFPVYLKGFFGVPATTFGLLLAFNGLLILVAQYPLIRGLQQRDHLLLAAVASALLGIGIGGAVIGGRLWWLVVIMVLFTVGEMIFVPISSSIVAGLAPAAARGRYMGVWSLVWVGGQAVAPTTMGWAMSSMGRSSYLIVIGAGFAGAALFVALRRVAARLGTALARQAGARAPGA
jgi:MFS family permease